MIKYITVRTDDEGRRFDKMKVSGEKRAAREVSLVHPPRSMSYPSSLSKRRCNRKEL